MVAKYSTIGAIEPSSLGVVFVAKADFVVVDGEQAIVGDSDAVGVASAPVARPDVSPDLPPGFAEAVP